MHYNFGPNLIHWFVLYLFEFRIKLSVLSKWFDILHNYMNLESNYRFGQNGSIHKKNGMYHKMYISLSFVFPFETFFIIIVFNETQGSYSLAT
jgi:hypothetical protein